MISTAYLPLTVDVEGILAGAAAAVAAAVVVVVVV
jgi:hypothetical protein